MNLRSALWPETLLTVRRTVFPLVDLARACRELLWAERSVAPHRARRREASLSRVGAIDRSATTSRVRAGIYQGQRSPCSLAPVSARAVPSLRQVRTRLPTWWHTGRSVARLDPRRAPNASAVPACVLFPPGVLMEPVRRKRVIFSPSRAQPVTHHTGDLNLSGSKGGGPGTTRGAACFTSSLQVAPDRMSRSGVIPEHWRRRVATWR